MRFNSQNPFYGAVGESIDLMQSRNLVRIMSLVFLVTVFKEYLQRVLTITFKKRPEALKSCQKNLSYEELVILNDISKVRETIIEKETAIVNEDIEIIRGYIQKKFGLDISKIMTAEVAQKLGKLSSALFNVNKPYEWTNFKERFYRRNLIIHNSGIPNKVYRQKTGYDGDYEALRVSKEYLDESIALFWVLAFNIGLAFEEKIDDNNKASDEKT